MSLEVIEIDNEEDDELLLIEEQTQPPKPSLASYVPAPFFHVRDGQSLHAHTLPRLACRRERGWGRRLLQRQITGRFAAGVRDGLQWRHLFSAFGQVRSLVFLLCSGCGGAEADGWSGWPL